MVGYVLTYAYKALVGGGGANDAGALGPAGAGINSYILVFLLAEFGSTAVNTYNKTIRCCWRAALRGGVSELKKSKPGTCLRRNLIEQTKNNRLTLLKLHARYILFFYVFRLPHAIPESKRKHPAAKPARLKFHPRDYLNCAIQKSVAPTG